MAAKSTADGMSARVMTCSPFAAAQSDSAKESLRKNLNEWILSTYGNAALNIESIVVSDWADNALHPAIYGDGTHYTGNGKISVGKFIAGLAIWDFESPSNYQRVDIPTLNWVGANNNKPASVNVNTGVAADVNAAVAAVSELRLMGYSAKETAVIPAAASARIVHGATGAAGTAVVNINLTASESKTVWFGPSGIAMPNGISIDWITGQLDIDVYYKIGN